MIASGLMPRSPGWLRKIPSTVSGSQGSRRGFPPAVRFAFPLGARLNTTLRARPCQELFSESFSRPSRGPRGAPPSGLRPFAAASSALYAPRARRGRETRPHPGCRQLQRGGAKGDAGGRAASAGRFASPRGPGVSPRPMSPASPCSLPPSFSRRGSLPKEERPPPGRFSMSEGFHHFDIEEAKVRPPIRMLKHFHRVRSYTCMPNRPWPRS